MKWLRIFGVVAAAVLLTTLGVGAADTWRGNSGSLLGQLIGARQPTGCPAGMIAMPGALTFSCVDVYEASAADTCIVHEPTTAEGSISNLADTDCKAQSAGGVMPWRFVTREQAMTACVKSGKRLPTAAEWYQVSHGVPAQKCNSSSGNVAETGSASGCVSVSGVFDVIGNVWEWVSDDVIDGVYLGRVVPDAGYITQVDAGGVATVTSQNPASSTDGYLWSNKSGAFGMIRGGFYGSQSDAGQYTIQAATSPNFSGTAIGFRCVE